MPSVTVAAVDGQRRHEHERWDRSVRADSPNACVNSLPFKGHLLVLHFTETVISVASSFRSRRSLQWFEAFHCSQIREYSRFVIPPLLLPDSKGARLTYAQVQPLGGGRLRHHELW